MCYYVPRGKLWDARYSTAGMAYFEEELADRAKKGAVTLPRHISTEVGRIVLSDEVIATIAGAAASECYGIVGMSSGRFRDGIATILGRDSISRGVEVDTSSEGLKLTLHIIVGYGTRISEVAHNVIEKVSYTLEQATGLRVEEVNIKVDGVQVKE